MKRYPPTTEQVRWAYTGDEPVCFCCANYVEEAGAEFDLWLAEEIRKAQAEAWAEGFTASQNRFLPLDNPYMEES